MTPADIEKNPDAVIDAIAKALGESPEEISIDTVEETDEGITVIFICPGDSEKPADFTDKVEEELKKTPEFNDVDVTDPGISFFFLFSKALESMIAWILCDIKDCMIWVWKYDEIYPSY